MTKKQKQIKKWIEFWEETERMCPSGDVVWL